MNRNAVHRIALRLRLLVSLLLALSLSLAGGPALAEGLSMDPDKWVFSITPYLWLPNVNGTLQYSAPNGVTGNPSVDVGADQYLSDLKMAALLAGEARKDRWAIATDIIYMNFGSQDSAVKSVDFGALGRRNVTADAGSSSSLKALVWSLGGSYSLLKDHPGALEALGGFRYFGIDVSTDWNLSTTITSPLGNRNFPRAGSVSDSVDIWDAIIGLRGTLRLGESNWYFSYYGDIGAGTESSSTYQWLVSLSYQWHWGGVVLAYRELYVDQSGDKLIQNMRFSGPALGVTFRF